MKNKHFIPLILLLFVALPSFAQQVSVEEALQSAKQFLRGTTQSGKRKANAVDKMALAYKKQKADKTSFYIFNGTHSFRSPAPGWMPTKLTFLRQ